ncbi:MAG: hypothetical protein Q7J31_09785 [Syntrophales bacterium]|nr:hypothetical protein [Syntrophales bacterium]
MYDDPIVEEVRKIRERMAEKYDFDVGAIFEDLRKRQSAIEKRLVRRVRKGVAEQEATPDRYSAMLHPGR